MPNVSPPELPSSSRKQKPRHSLFKRFALAVGIAIAAIACVAYLMEDFRVYRIPTNAMSPSIKKGDHVFTEGLSYWFREPRRGEIVVFRTRGISRISQHAPMNGDQRYVKRLIGLPGDHIRISDDGKVFVNDEHFAPNSTIEAINYTRTGTTEVLVPEESYFVLGDNSAASFDSRGWGFVPQKNLLSRVIGK